MIINNKLDNFFGAGASMAGYILILAGILVGITQASYIVGSLFIIVGSFMAFSFLGAEILPGDMKYRVYNKIFGLIKIGQYKKLNHVTSIGVIKYRGGYVTYSRSNRRMDNSFKDYRVVFQGESAKEKDHVYKSSSYQNAKNEAIRLSELLNIPLLKI